MKLPCKVQFINEKLQKEFNKLKEGTKEESNFYEWLTTAFNCIEENAFCSIQIPKRLIPKEYFQKHNIHNAWKYNLPNVWRLIYSIENRETAVVAIILEWMTHKEYERKFNYK